MLINKKKEKMKMRSKVFFSIMTVFALAMIMQGSGIAAGQGKGPRLNEDSNMQDLAEKIAPGQGKGPRLNPVTYWEYPTVKDYKTLWDRYDKGGFIDYWMGACLQGDDGNEYFMTLAIFKADRGGRDLAIGQVVISEEPLRYYTTPSKKIIRTGEIPEIKRRFAQPVEALKTKFSSSSFKVELEGWQFTVSPPGSVKARYQGKDVSLDLNYKMRGNPVWFSNGTKDTFRASHSNQITGFESLGNFEGTMTYKGKKIGVKGTGVFEHALLPTHSWIEFIWLDWMWFNFDELYGLLFESKGGGVQTGGIYLIKEKEFLPIKKLFIDHPEWAYSPVNEHQFPIKFSAEAHTDKGVLFIEGDVVRSQPMKQIDKYQYGATMPFSDMGIDYRGTFVYNDGRTLKLNNGKGGDEMIATYNFVESHQ
jgi:hypothetical protein